MCFCNGQIDLTVDCLTPDYGYVSDVGISEATAGFASFAASHLLVNHGKYYYEAVILTPNVGQIGWAIPMDFKVKSGMRRC